MASACFSIIPKTPPPFSIIRAHCLAMCNLYQGLTDEGTAKKIREPAYDLYAALASGPPEPVLYRARLLELYDLFVSMSKTEAAWNEAHPNIVITEAQKLHRYVDGVLNKHLKGLCYE